jgi:Neprosin
MNHWSSTIRVLVRACACLPLALVPVACGEHSVSDAELPPELVAVRELPAAGAVEAPELLTPRLSARGVVKVLRTPGGIVDCMDADRQPGVPEGGRVAEPPPDPNAGHGAIVRSAAQIMHCPTGTVPLARDVQRFIKPPPPIAPPADPGCPLASATHLYSVVKHTVPRATGMSAILTVWDPDVSAGEFSLSQLWGASGDPCNHTEQTIEAGWIKLANEGFTRLFVYYTPDYYTTGCFDTCAFVSVANAYIIPGYSGNLYTSSFTGTKYQIQLTWLQKGGDWWLYYADVNADGSFIGGGWIGYFPGTLFNAAGISTGITEADFGGEVYPVNLVNPHTATDMGSGRFGSPTDGYLADWTAYQDVLTYSQSQDSTYHPLTVPVGTLYTPESQCYTGFYENDRDEGGNATLFFGGTGYSASCTTY